MQSAELRDRFLKFFEARGHRVVPSDTLIPGGDPTVLFTSAGMNQFKDCFLGRRTDLSRAASCQKCLRTGDLDKVGKTAGHHSFFEMLGNFSFGDYFKREAIQWAWEFLTGTLDYAGERLSPDREPLCVRLAAKHLWVSIYEEDEEAHQLWRALGVPEPRIKRFGQADNFWPANAPTEGPNGPCGPCSEIYYDPEGKVQGPKSVEVWNLVFTQYDRQPDGSLTPLPKPNIDTGMGLERLASVVQGTETDYETDLFQPIVSAITDRFHGRRNVSEESETIHRVADHLRAIAFLLAENLIPSNEERGYVVRMLIRRAHWHLGRLLWRPKDQTRRSEHLEPFLVALVDSVIDTYAPVYHELKQQEGYIQKALHAEEKRFAETLEVGNEQIHTELERLETRRQRQISGDFAFKMKDTYGYPFELLTDIAEREGFQIDRAVFEQRLAEQRERSRAGSQFGSGIFVAETLPIRQTLTGLPSKDAQFVGYEALGAEGTIQGLWDGQRWITKAEADRTVGIVLSRSPFYGESGGQVGDLGTIEGPQGVAEVTQTAWVDDVLVHHARVRTGCLSVQEPVRAQVDAERRLKVARSHTAAHLLHWALRKVLGPETAQAGSLVEADRVRFDFSSLQGVREEQRARVEALVNSRVRMADGVRATQMPLEDAKRAGALALFGEKYGAQVRVVTIGDYSKELCGGTHLPHTGFVGWFRIIGESSIAAGTRRMEALVGEAAADRSRDELRLLHEAARRLGRPAQELVEGLDDLLGQLKRTEHERKAFQQELAKVEARRLTASGTQINGVTYIAARIERADREALATLADAVRGSLAGEGVVLLVSSEGHGHVAWVMAATAGMAKRVHAGHLMKEIAALTQGSGGGRPEFAQAGGKDPSRIPEAIARAEQLVREALTSVV